MLPSQGGASVTEPEQIDRHQRQTLILGVASLVGVILVVIGTMLVAPLLNRFGFLHFPLGFYLAAQGLFIAIIVAAFVFVKHQDRLDLRREEGDGEDIA
jgi:putative solute:sodium symporter small subunit